MQQAVENQGGSSKWARSVAVFRPWVVALATLGLLVVSVVGNGRDYRERKLATLSYSAIWDQNQNALLVVGETEAFRISKIVVTPMFKADASAILTKGVPVSFSVIMKTENDKRVWRKDDLRNELCYTEPGNTDLCQSVDGSPRPIRSISLVAYTQRNTEQSIQVLQKGFGS